MFKLGITRRRHWTMLEHNGDRIFVGVAPKRDSGGGLSIVFEGDPNRAFHVVMQTQGNEQAFPWPPPIDTWRTK